MFSEDFYCRYIKPGFVWKRVKTFWKHKWHHQVNRALHNNTTSFSRNRAELTRTRLWMWLNPLPQNTAFWRIHPVPNKPWFLRVCSTSLLKTLLKKGKLLVTNNFSFSHNVFYPFAELSIIYIKFQIVICKVFQFERVSNLLFGKGLKIYSRGKHWEKEKLLEKSNFSFSHHFFYSIWYLFSILNAL